jgi:ABC-type oligopeptide transport system substrate-binding subunit
MTTWEISIALEAARAILDNGDKVGARMAFISAYERIVHEARCEAKPVAWELSLGFDPKRRAVAVEKAVKLQRITQERAQLYLADLSIAPIKADGLAIAGLITGNAYMPTDKSRKRIEQLRADMKKYRQASVDEKLAIKIAAANDLAERRALLMQQAEQLTQSEGVAP